VFEDKAEVAVTEDKGVIGTVFKSGKILNVQHTTCTALDADADRWLLPVDEEGGLGPSPSMR
jgi:hypothetical protein